ncbi:vgrG protein [Pseudomonas putida]|jgi:type VI secretion system secreted protein VgrG|nr:type VI secretion system secreted protein VgrG [Pseudomonas putida]SMQ00545.1 type VI secretion system secreted protein VgrG [Pseudomonas putida]VEE40520.1 vgrG protein [Pseudomonas putida]VTQ37366.1 vgrG protein [Pseudomonas putida]
MATVVGPPGEEIYCDEWGRVKVSFPWDRESQNNEFSSCWLRVSQGWAGGSWGSMAIPRIGQDVIIHYVNGDPDQPMITGRTYCGDQLPPYDLPDHKTRMTIKSQTHKGEGFNELRFEDELGKEEVFIHAQRDQNTLVNHNQSLSVGVDRTQQVGQDESVAIGRNRLRVVKANDTLKVGGGKNDLIAGDYEVEAGNTLRLKCGKTLIEMHANGTLNITCETFNFTAQQTGQINTLAAKLDLNPTGGSAGAGANGRDSDSLKADVDGHFD